MAGSRLRVGAWIATAVMLMASSLVFANNPDGSHPTWDGPFGEQVDMYTGELSLSATDVNIPTRGGIPLTFTRSYSSELYQLQVQDSIRSSCYGLAGSGRSFKPFGWGWHLPVVRITDDMVFYSDGQYEPFFVDAKNRKRTRSFAVLKSYGQYDSLALQYPNGITWIFGDSVAFGGAPHLNGRYLKRVTDHTAKNYVDYTYADHNGESAGGLLVRMQDQTGRYIKIYYNSLIRSDTARVDSVEYKGTGGTIRRIRYTYSNGNLANVAYPDGRTLSYTYEDSIYCGQNKIGIPSTPRPYLLSSVTIPTGGKVKYSFERFSEILHDPLDTLDGAKYYDHFAIRSIDIDSSGTAYNYAYFYRDPDGGNADNSASQVKVICDSCASGDREVYSWEFKPKWINHDLSSESGNLSRCEKYGVPFTFSHFKAPASCSDFCYGGDGSYYYDQSYFANYDEWYNQYHGGYQLIKIGRDTRPGVIDTAIWYPVLKGYKQKVPGGSLEWVLQDAQIDPYVGITMSYKGASDSVFQILDHTYDTTNHMFYVERNRFNGIDRRFVYDSTGSVPNNPNYRRTYLISGVDSVESKFDYDSVGNVIRVYDNLGQVLNSIQYDTSLTFPFVTTSRLGLVDSSSYDAWTGNLLSATSANGTKREFEYDNADRLTRARRVGDSCDNLKRSYAADHRSIVDSILVDSSPCRYRIERNYYTIFNLLAQSRVDSIYNYVFSGQYNSSIVDYEYNRQLRLKRRSNPHFDYELYAGLKWTDYKYDYAGRPVRIDYPNTTNDDGSTSQNTSRFAYNNYDDVQYDWLNRRTMSRGDKLGRLLWTEYKDSSAAGNFADSTTINYLGNTRLQSSIVMPGNKTISYTYDQFRRLRTATKPNEGTDTLYHDKMGNLRFKCDSRGIWTSFKYDSLYRLIEVRTSTTVNKDSANSLYYMPTGTSRISYVFGRYDFSSAADTLNAHYDTTGTGYNAHRWIKGMLTQVNDEACTTLFLYDQQGRVAKKYIHYNPVEKWSGSYVSSGFKMITYKYSSADAIASIRYPRDIAWVDYEYGKSGLLARVPGFIQDYGVPTAPAVTYTPWGAVARTKYANTMLDETLYDDLMRIVRNTSYNGIPYNFGES